MIQITAHCYITNKIVIKITIHCKIRNSSLILSKKIACEMIIIISIDNLVIACNNNLRKFKCRCKI